MDAGRQALIPVRDTAPQDTNSGPSRPQSVCYGPTRGPRSSSRVASHAAVTTLWYRTISPQLLAFCTTPQPLVLESHGRYRGTGPRLQSSGVGVRRRCEAACPWTVTTSSREGWTIHANLALSEEIRYYRKWGSSSMTKLREFYESNPMITKVLDPYLSVLSEGVREVLLNRVMETDPRCDPNEGV